MGPEFDSPEYYSNYQPYDPEHPFNTPSNWEKVEYRADQEIQAGTDIHVTFAPVKAKAMRWRMDRKADTKGVAITEMAFIAPSEDLRIVQLQNFLWMVKRLLTSLKIVWITK